MKCSKMTCRAALKKLILSGDIYVKKGSGYFVLKGKRTYGTRTESSSD
jgi:DNA-binding GntR family transcriptional regulator